MLAITAPLWYKYAHAVHVDCVYTHSVVSWCKGSTRDFDSLCLGSNPGETSKMNLLTVEIMQLGDFFYNVIIIILPQASGREA